MANNCLRHCYSKFYCFETHKTFLKHYILLEKYIENQDVLK